MTDEEIEEALDQADYHISLALNELISAHINALEAEEWELSAGIHHTMTMLERMLGFVPAPRPTHRVTEALQ